MLDVPAAFHELDRQPVEQLLIHGRLALRADVVEDFRNPGSKKHLPQAVHEYTRRQRIVATGHPIREIEPRQPLAVRLRRIEKMRRLWLDDFSGIIHPIAARQNAHFARLDRLGDQGFTGVIEQDFLAAFQLANLGPVGVVSREFLKGLF